MGIMHPGYFPDTYFPDKYWIDDYWADYGPIFLRGITTISDILGSAPSISSHKSDSTISNTLNNEGSII